MTNQHVRKYERGTHHETQQLCKCERGTHVAPKPKVNVAPMLNVVPMRCNGIHACNNAKRGTHDNGAMVNVAPMWHPRYGFLTEPRSSN